MHFKLFILLLLLVSHITLLNADKNFSISIELENDTLDISENNLYKGMGDPAYGFWVNAIITNESTSPKKLITYSCSGTYYEIESKLDLVKPIGSCRQNIIGVSLLQPKEIYKDRLHLHFTKNYAGDTLKFRINYSTLGTDLSKTGWSKFVTMKLRRK